MARSHCHTLLADIRGAHVAAATNTLQRAVHQLSNDRLSTQHLYTCHLVLSATHAVTVIQIHSKTHTERAESTQHKPFVVQWNLEDVIWLTGDIVRLHAAPKHQRGPTTRHHIRISAWRQELMTADTCIQWKATNVDKWRNCNQHSIQQQQCIHALWTAILSSTIFWRHSSLGLCKVQHIHNR